MGYKTGNPEDIFYIMQDEYPPIGQKFVAIYSDGSGAEIYQRLDVDFIDGSGNLCDDEVLDNYCLWAPLPDHFEFFHEG